MEWSWQGRTELLGENLSKCDIVSQVTHELARRRTRVSADRGRQLIALALAREYVDNTKTFACYLPRNVTFSLQSIF